MELKFEHEIDEHKRKKIIREIILWVLEIALVITAAYMIVDNGLFKTQMVGNSMQNTLKNKDEVLVSKLSYSFTDPKRFDIVAYKQNGSEQGYYTIKRIIGLPGETICIKDGEIYINDKKLDEKIQVEKMTNGGVAEQPYHLDDKEYFVLGDNRNQSEDSRFANVGCVLRKDILGKAWVRTNHLAFISSLNQKTEKDKK